MTKQTIEVELPEGWKAITYRVPVKGEYVINSGQIKQAPIGMIGCWLIVEKIQPRRIVLEETNEINEQYKSGFYATQTITFKGGVINISDMKNLWREVKENGLSLNSDDAKLSLSVDELQKYRYCQQ